MDKLTYRIGAIPPQRERAVTCREEQKGEVRFIHFTVQSEKEAVFTPLTLRIYVPAIQVHYRWSPKLHLIKGLNSDWFENLYLTNGFTGAPVECLLSPCQKNCACIGLSDTLSTIGLKALPVEETGEYEFEIRLFCREAVPRKSYEITVRLDMREIPYYQSLQEVSRWWETLEGMAPAFVPPNAKELVYSTWYSYHQRVSQDELLKQCTLAKELGCGTVIIDDGWQTEDNARGYAYCGDWEAAKSKMPDIRKFTDSLHQIGMRAMFWYSVPFIGERSANFARFQDMLIDPDAQREWHVLDPRYPAVREFIIGLYEKALAEWGLDGFKLDFVDEFVVTGFSGRESDSRRDYQSFEEAADRLMTDCISRLKQIKPDILLEFRQTYNGPRMRTYGNIFRAVDCPMDDVENKVRVTDIRLIAGDSAVHSDMVMWHYEDSVESAALQIIQILFSVPQISMRLEELKREHYQMLKFYCSLWKRYKQAFTDGEFIPLHPTERYSVIKGIHKNIFVCTYHLTELIEMENCYDEMLFINGTCRSELIISVKEEGMFDREVYDCMGNLTQKDRFYVKMGVQIWHVPESGCVLLKKCRSSVIHSNER